MLSVAAGCEKQRPQAAEPERSPTEVIHILIDARQRQEYSALDRFVLPERINGVVDTLKAVDEFLAANGELCSWVRREIGEAAGRGIDSSRLAESLDVFSPRVELKSERIEGDRAIVGYTVSGNLPLKRCELLRRDGRWWYDPGDGYAATLPTAFRHMAEALQRVLAELKSQQQDSAALPRDSEVLAELLRRHLGPAVAELPKPPTSQSQPSEQP